MKTAEFGLSRRQAKRRRRELLTEAIAKHTDAKHGTYSLQDDGLIYQEHAKQIDADPELRVSLIHAAVKEDFEDHDKASRNQLNRLQPTLFDSDVLGEISFALGNGDRVEAPKATQQQLIQSLSVRTDQHIKDLNAYNQHAQWVNMRLKRWSPADRNLGDLERRVQDEQARLNTNGNSDHA